MDDIDVTMYDAPSNVPESPHDEQTYQGACNRADGCRELGSADYYVGIESGLVERYGNFFEEAWAVIITPSGESLVGYSSGLLLPPVVSDRMKKGELHNAIMADYDELFNLFDDNKDTWSRYSGGNISRQLSLEESVRNALVQSIGSEHNLYGHS
jgi:non-canonical (house-cleaning) NTP pyrophosphatase